MPNILARFVILFAAMIFIATGVLFISKQAKITPAEVRFFSIAASAGGEHISIYTAGEGGSKRYLVAPITEEEHRQFRTMKLTMLEEHIVSRIGTDWKPDKQEKQK